jgi:hypothetical protein
MFCLAGSSEHQRAVKSNCCLRSGSASSIVIVGAGRPDGCSSGATGDGAFEVIEPNRSPETAGQSPPRSQGPPSPTVEPPTLRQLWSDQVFITRRYIIDAVTGPPVSELLVRALGEAVPPIATAPGIRDLVPHFGPGDAAAVRLLENVEAMGDAIVPHFGKEAASDFTKLLRTHVLIAVELLSAARAGDIPKFKSEDERWTSNADQIADALNRLNEFWPREELARRLHLLLQLTKDEAVARVTGAVDGDLRTFDRIYAEAMGIADALDAGLAQRMKSQGKTASDERGGQGA